MEDISNLELFQGLLSLVGPIEKTVQLSSTAKESESAPQNNDALPTQLPSVDSSPDTMASKLRAIADSMTEKIKYKLDPPIGRQRKTRRRQDIATSMKEEGRRMKLAQTWLYALADLHDQNAVPLCLSSNSIRSLQKLLYCMAGLFKRHWQLTHDPHHRDVTTEQIFHDKHYSYVRDALSPCQINTPADYLNLVDTLNKLASGQPLTTQELTIHRLERDLIGQKIPGYFPTPPKLVDRVVRLARIESGNTILEPEAGKGDIAARIRSDYPNNPLSVIEIDLALRELLALKGFNLVANDFLAYNGQHDRIVMNPPFENGQDCDHIIHAYNCLLPRGRLVSIASTSYTFRKERKYDDFRNFLSSVGAFQEQLPEGAFFESDRPTGIRTMLIAIDK